jgi:ligand-binding sensor domain-containing protein
LYHYNGESFKKYKPIKNDSGSIDNLWIHSLLRDHEGNIWIGTDDGLNVLRKITGKIQRVKLEKEESNRIIRPYAIAEDEKNRIWVGKYSGGIIYVINPENKKAEKIKLPTEHLISDLQVLKNGDVLAAAVDDGGLFCISSDLKQIRKIEAKNLSPSFDIKCLERGIGKIWVGGLRRGLIELNESSLNQSNQTAAPIKGTENLKVNALAYDKISNRLWVAATPGGLYCYDLNDFSFKPIQSKKLALDNFEVRCFILTQLKENWLGTSSGLIHLKNSSSPFKKTEVSTSLTGTSPVISIYIDKQGYYWYSLLNDKEGVGTNRPGASLLLSKLKKTIAYNIFSMLQEGDNMYFLSEKAMYILNLKTTELQTVLKGNGMLNSEYLSCQMWKNQLLIGTTRDGLMVMDPAKNFAPLMNSLSGNLKELNGLGVHGFTNYKNKYLLVWTAKGLFVLNAKMQVITRFTDDILTGKYVVGAGIDGNNFLWVAYYGEGVDLVYGWQDWIEKGTSPRVINFNENTGMKTNACMGLQIDKYNLVWVSTTNGLYRISASNRLSEKGKKLNLKEFFSSDIDKSSFVKGYFTDDGLTDNDFSAFCSVKSPVTNNLYFAGTRGMISFNPEQVQINPRVNKIQLTGFRIFEKDYPLDTSITQKKHITLNYNQKFISFEFDLTYYNDFPGKSQFAFQMVGFDKDWIYSGNRRFARYTNLSPGDYLFRVKGTNEDGVWGKEIAYVHIIINPPFWQTYWFYAFCVIAILVSIFLTIRYREFKFRAENKLLEEKVHLRTQEIAEINETLTRKNRDITDSINYARRIQQSILPKENELKRYFPESFIIYQPKDIVSGDFYWIQKILNETPEKFTIQIAVADCTGHGVPGALMSMIGIDKLNEAVSNFISPGNILEYMNISVKTALRQSANEELQTRDGMDIALLAITMHKYSSHVMVEYAGANRPLWFFDSEGQLHEIKPDKVAIAGFTREEQTFHTHTFHLNKKQRLYLFTDGYADQFGGPHDSKFMIKRFRKLIIELQELPMNEQIQALKKEFHDWKGANEQVDDILIVGIEL